MPRLLFITDRFPPDIGGLASSADRITKAFCQLGVDVDVLTWSRSLQPGDVLLPDSSLSSPTPPQLYRVGRYRHWDMTMPHTLNLLNWLQQKHQYDAVWGHYLLPGGFLATWFAQLKGLPSIVSARGNDIDRELFPPGDFSRLQWTLERADFVTAVSADIAHKIQVLSRRDDVVVLKNAVNDQIFAPTGDISERQKLRESLGIAADEVVLGFAGELREKKGQTFLLNALTTVRNHRPACLLIIGEVRESQEAVLHRFGAEYPEVRSRIIITGYLPKPEEVAKHLQLCDVYLQPSLWDGMPNALLEAMACGCCCIASNAGGIPEIIEHGVNGFILPCSQLHHLGEAVLECLELDAEQRQRIGKAGRDRIQLEFSLDAEKARLQRLLEGIRIF
ncbi:MAG: glycosyltransferase family 4 protein [Coleofasciculus sp. Co-bin14]|nr:glycosyltransferase family 4 protein [Coleofasciculus sp. Co-bin14]